jgi:FAD/FMN-containing dehydrogenase
MAVYNDSTLTEQAVATLRARLRGQVIAPADAAYDTARRVWNASIDRFPGAIARCVDHSDVVAAVNVAREAQVALAVRGGGHDVAGNGTCDGGLVLDLSGMKGIDVDPVYKAARVEPGVVWGGLDAATTAHGLAVTGGQISSTGVAGLTLGGGLGWLMRDGGLTIDSLLSVDLVTAAGTRLRASEADHPDLFWAVRGGGGNFGVVTAFEFRLRPLGEIIGGTVAHPIERAAEVLEFFHGYAETAPETLTPMAYFFFAPAIDAIPAPMRGRGIASIAVCYTGDAADANTLLEPVHQFGPPLVDRVQPMPYTTLQRLFDAGSLPGAQNYWKSWYLRPLTAEARAVIVEHVQRITSPLSIVLVTPMGGAIRRVAADATAFGHRDAAYVLEILAKWDDPAADASPHIAWADAFFEAMRPFSTGGAYVNFLGNEGPERIQAAYTAHGFARLREVKRRYDPDNFFRVNQNIAP